MAVIPHEFFNFSFHRLPLKSITDIDCMLLILRTEHRLDILPNFQSPSSPMDTLYALAGTSRLIVLGDFNINDKDISPGWGQGNAGGGASKR